MKVLSMVFVLLWTGCEDLDFPDPNNPTSDTATIQSLVTGAEAQLRSGFGVWIRDLLVVGREAYYLEPADPRYTGELLQGPVGTSLQRQGAQGSRKAQGRGAPGTNALL